MRWPWSPRETPVDHDARVRLSSVLAKVSEHLTVVVNDLEKSADRKLTDDS